MANLPVGGTLNFRVGGTTYQARGNFTYSAQAETRESVVGADGVHGHTVAKKAPFIAGDLTLSALWSTETLMAHDGTVELECVNGITVVLEDAILVGEVDPNPIEGSVSIRFEGLAGREYRR